MLRVAEEINSGLADHAVSTHMCVDPLNPSASKEVSSPGRGLADQLLL